MSGACVLRTNIAARFRGVQIVALDHAEYFWVSEGGRGGGGGGRGGCRMVSNVLK